MNLAKRLIAALAAAGLVLATAGCDEEPGKATARVQLLSISDWHGQLDPLSQSDAAGNSVTYGGVGLLSAYFKAARASNPATLTLAAGDLTGATPVLSSAFEDAPAIAALNFLGLDATTIGNHDFDRGVANLTARMEESDFKWVSSNLTNVSTELGAKALAPYAIVEAGESDPKVKVGLIGVLTEEAPSLIFPGRMGGVTVEEPVAAANAAAAAARAAGAMVVVAMTHMGANATDAQGNPTGPLIDFARGLRGVDVVLGDHTDMTVNATVGDALVVQNRAKGRTFASINVDVVDEVVTARSARLIDPMGTATHALATGESCPADCPDSTWTCSDDAKSCLKTSMAADPAAEELLQPYRDQLAGKHDVKLATTDGLFERNKSLERKQEAPLGDLVADALLDRYKASHGAQIAFTNGGGLRDSLPSSYEPQASGLTRTDCSAANRCDIVVGDVYGVLPFGNTCVVRKISGALLWQVLEASVGANLGKGGFLQIAGFKFEYDPAADAGSRVLGVRLLEGDRAIARNDATEYTLVTNDFTNSGGDGYGMLAQSTSAPALEVMADVVAEYLENKGTLSPSDYSGRIVAVEVGK